MQFLTLMQATFTWCLNGMKWLFGMAAHTTQMPPWVYYLLHYGVVAIVTIVLCIFNEQVLSIFGEGASLPQILYVEHCWAGILFLLTYLFIRLLIYFIALFWQEDESEFSDIDQAWAYGEAGLAREGIDIGKVPLFLINGLDEVQEPHFFRAAGFNAKVVAPGPEQHSPLRFYANGEALFIACSDVSAISSQVRAPRIAGNSMGGAEGSLGQGSDTLTAGQLERFAGAGVDHTMMPGKFAGQATGTLTAEAMAAGTVTLKRSAGSQEPIDYLTCERRVRHLCRLIMHSRAPVCPINGLLAAVPLDWTRQSADQIYYESVKQDVGVLHEGLHMMFPVVCMFTGLHQLGAIQEFIDRVRLTEPAFNSNVRAGAHFPPALPVDEGSAKWVADKGIEWFRAWIYQAFARDLASPTNPQLYRLLCNLEERRSGLIRLLQAAFGNEVNGERIRLAGCYYAGIEVRTRQQAFVRGVIEKLIRDQELVTYPEPYRQQDEMFGNLGYVCCFGIVILACADMYLLLWKW